MLLVYQNAGDFSQRIFAYFNGGAKTHGKLLSYRSNIGYCYYAGNLYSADSDVRCILLHPDPSSEKERKRSSADEVVTIGGIIGRIVSIKDDTVVIETAGDRSKIRLARWSIQQNITATERAAQEQADKKSK